AGAYRQFKDAIAQNQDMSKVLDGMLAQERVKVLDEFKKHGVEAAARVYGVARSRRANYAYSLVDTPEIFTDGAYARAIPFTTWSRNQFMRMTEDIDQRNYKKIAARIAKPLAYLAVFRTIMGYDIPGAHPLASVPALSE